MARALLEDINKTNGPDKSIVGQFLDLFNDFEEDLVYLAGDSFGFPGLKENACLKFVEAKAVQLPDEDERDEEIFDQDFDLQLTIKVHAAKEAYSDTCEAKKKLFHDIKKWLCSDYKDYCKVFDQQLTKSEALFHEVTSNMLVDSYCASDLIGNVIDSSFNYKFWNKHMNNIIKEGVCYAGKLVPDDLRKSLQKHIDEVADQTQVDHHPNSNYIVRDLVHPALYPYIQGISKVKKGANLPAKLKDEKSDFWGRDYEKSKFQWLPTPFQITDDRKCIVNDYINNLDRGSFLNLYRDLESLFEIFLPFFEEVWSYAKAMDFFKGDDDNDDEVDEIPDLDKKPTSFTGKELQVIVKIVDYTLQPGQAYEGVWHAEGMSHENIVMTGIYFLDRSAAIEGGDLRFKRAFTTAERQKVFWSLPQSRPAIINQFAAEGFMPLGYFPTMEGHLLVFPNCHIHKISKMVNVAEKESASRRIVVFFFVNPERKIVSTREIAPQQNVIPLKRAKNYRLELMAERKYDKEKLNVRDIELCEH